MRIPMYSKGNVEWARYVHILYQRSMQPSRGQQKVSRGRLRANAVATGEAVSAASSDEGSRLDGKLKIIGGPSPLPRRKIEAA